mmetsp:Transcript_10362/g.28615  ORF Transcript_10362/g.28615 Transcript_10362/m.28615 type:complete len:158 (+) Transcript_10362:591-1064(+)
MPAAELTLNFYSGTLAKTESTGTIPAKEGTSALWTDVGDKNAQNWASKSLGERDKLSPTKRSTGNDNGLPSSSNNKRASGSLTTVDEPDLDQQKPPAATRHTSSSQSGGIGTFPSQGAFGQLNVQHYLLTKQNHMDHAAMSGASTIVSGSRNNRLLV